MKCNNEPHTGKGQKKVKTYLFSFATPVSPSQHAEMDRALEEANRAEWELFGEELDEDDENEPRPVPERPTASTENPGSAARQQPHGDAQLQQGDAQIPQPPVKASDMYNDDQRARTTPTPTEPSQAERDLHMMTHMPYKNWCLWCVRNRCPNAKHMTIKKNGRNIPLLCADYCFPKDKTDITTSTVLAGRLYPTRRTLSLPCLHKGEDARTVARLSEWIRGSGLLKLAYKSDQEKSLKTLLEKAVTKLGREDVLHEAVPEESPVGESASNGKAERAVQDVEDLLRTLKAFPIKS